MASSRVHRSRQFADDREPLRNSNTLRIVQSRVRGPVAFLNPTQAHYEHKIAISPNRDRPSKTDLIPLAESSTLSTTNIEYKWTARDNRKGRHTLITRPLSVEHPETNISTPRSTTTWRSVLHTLWLMITFYPVWDVSWCVAFIFTLGSVLWVINALFVFLPLIRPSSTFHDEALVGGGITAFIGATIFEVGSILLMLEAINEHRQGCFSFAVESTYDVYAGRVGAVMTSHLRITPQGCTHHHQNKKNLVGKPDRVTRNATPGLPSDKSQLVKTGSWVWCPSWNQLKTHYLHELGFIASLSQFLGATIFWVSGVTALPGIYNALSPGLSDGIYWTPQVVGGAGFILSGWLFMIETQKYWWLPAPTVLGWHIGAWNLIGGIGFTLCPAFGYGTSSWAQYQASCSTFWGSWAFLIGSLIQLYESLDKTPVKTASSV
ncbi:hypothetical protein E4T47_01782 [Aureobasidium subglaciale]|nr:hypothetical protein E4T47_01782 [Aureobasidium subglaciale]